jgi:hypothetical protein
MGLHRVWGWTIALENRPVIDEAGVKNIIFLYLLSMLVPLLIIT